MSGSVRALGLPLVSLQQRLGQFADAFSRVLLHCDCGDVDHWKRTRFRRILYPHVTALEELVPAAAAGHKAFEARNRHLARVDNSYFGLL